MGVRLRRTRSERRRSLRGSPPPGGAGGEVLRTPMPVLLIATLDTKGREAAFIRALLTKAGVAVTVADAGVLGPPAFAADIPREELYRAAGTTLDAIRTD